MTWHLLVSLLFISHVYSQHEKMTFNVYEGGKTILAISPTEDLIATASIGQEGYPKAMISNLFAQERVYFEANLNTISIPHQVDQLIGLEFIEENGFYMFSKNFALYCEKSTGEQKDILVPKGYVATSSISDSDSNKYLVIAYNQSLREYQINNGVITQLATIEITENNLILDVIYSHEKIFLCFLFIKFEQNRQNKPVINCLDGKTHQSLFKIELNQSVVSKMQASRFQQEIGLMLDSRTYLELRLDKQNESYLSKSYELPQNNKEFSKEFALCTLSSGEKSVVFSEDEFQQDFDLIFSKIWSLDLDESKKSQYKFISETYSKVSSLSCSSFYLISLTENFIGVAKASDPTVMAIVFLSVCALVLFASCLVWFSEKRYLLFHPLLLWIKSRQIYYLLLVLMIFYLLQFSMVRDMQQSSRTKGDLHLIVYNFLILTLIICLKFVQFQNSERKRYKEVYFSDMSPVVDMASKFYSWLMICFGLAVTNVMMLIAVNAMTQNSQNSFNVFSWEFSLTAINTYFFCMIAQFSIFLAFTSRTFTDTRCYELNLMYVVLSFAITYRFMPGEYETKSIYDSIFMLIVPYSAFSYTLNSSLLFESSKVIGSLLGGNCVTLLFSFLLYITYSFFTKEAQKNVKHREYSYESNPQDQSAVLEQSLRTDSLEQSHISLIELNHLNLEIEKKKIFIGINFQLQINQFIIVEGEKCQYLLKILCDSQTGIQSTDIKFAKKLTFGIAIQPNLTYQFLNFQEHLKFYGKIKNLNDSQITRQTEDLIDLMAFQDQKLKSAKQLSGGNLQKLRLACAFIGNPKIIILNEPMKGLDLISKKRIWQYLKLKKEKGCSIVAGINDLNDVLAYECADKLYRINQEKMIKLSEFQFTEDEIKNSEYILQIKCKNPADHETQIKLSNILKRFKSNVFQLQQAQQIIVEGKKHYSYTMVNEQPKAYQIGNPNQVLLHLKKHHFQVIQGIVRDDAFEYALRKDDEWIGSFMQNHHLFSHSFQKIKDIEIEYKEKALFLKQFFGTFFYHLSQSNAKEQSQKAPRFLIIIFGTTIVATIQIALSEINRGHPSALGIVGICILNLYTISRRSIENRAKRRTLTKVSGISSSSYWAGHLFLDFIYNYLGFCIILRIVCWIYPWESYAQWWVGPLLYMLVFLVMFYMVSFAFTSISNLIIISFMLVVISYELFLFLKDLSYGFIFLNPINTLSQYFENENKEDYFYAVALLVQLICLWAMLMIVQYGVFWWQNRGRSVDTEGVKYFEKEQQIIRYGYEIDEEAEKKHPIMVRNLFKSYSPHHFALNDLSFHLKRGDILAFIGRNGAGKSTLFNILTLNIIKSSGVIRYFGKDLSSCGSDDFLRIGYSPQENVLNESATVESNINYFCRIKGMSERELEEFREEYLNYFLMKKRETEIVRNLSIEEKRIVCSIIAFAGNPQILLFDEPTVGMSYLNKAKLLHLIQYFAQHKQCAVVVTSHNLREAERLCNKVVVLIDGQICSANSMDEIINTNGHGLNVRIICANQYAYQEIEKEMQKKYQFSNTNHDLRQNKLEYSMPRQRNRFVEVFEQMRRLEAKKLVVGFEIYGDDLERAVIHVTKQSRRQVNEGQQE